MHYFPKNFSAVFCALLGNLQAVQIIELNCANWKKQSKFSYAQLLRITRFQISDYVICPVNFESYVFVSMYAILYHAPRFYCKIAPPSPSHAAAGKTQLTRSAAGHDSMGTSLNI